MLNNRRGDLMLLINGMPVFHIELKRSDTPVSQAQTQIENYAREKIFTGLFALVQVFVAMTPEDATYFANPGPDGKFNPQFYFRWADFHNNIISDWKGFASAFLNIPMAHQIIGFYTVADTQQGVLKVLRSYQYYAAHAISDKVSKSNWEKTNQLGGFIWHTTGSGKTLTSFKAAQLIASSKDADKVIFLIDRIELGTQSLEEYNAFKNDDEDVQATENSDVLRIKLKSNSPKDTLIVTSIQKMSRIKTDDNGLNTADIEQMQKKRIVIIVDEAHRSTFGDMLSDIKSTFPAAMFFGFTGTPIHEENKIKDNTTASVFGDELHRYSIYHGIRDKNVLGFDPYLVETFKAKDLKKAVALHEAKAETEEEALSDEAKKKVYLHFINDVEMAGHEDENGDYIKGIEDYIPNSQYNNDDENPEHRIKVVEDITENWTTLSLNSKFHAIFATSSIPEAIAYYRLIKEKKPSLKITALFDPHIGNDNPDGAGYKEDGLVEILTDYNVRYDMNFTIPTHADFKKDVSARLAHKKAYQNIANKPEEQIDLLIVVNQMLTGFDSKWLNTLYLDKEIEYANIIQAFSRTNRLFGEDKPFGTIRYYRRPHTMKRNIEKAVKLYSGDKPFALFVDKIDDNIKNMNFIFTDINELFEMAEIEHFEKLPKESADGKSFHQNSKNCQSFYKPLKFKVSTGTIANTKNKLILMKLLT
jgi:type I restriction enzyme R subunit